MSDKIDPNEFAKAFLIASGKPTNKEHAFKEYKAAFELAVRQIEETDHQEKLDNNKKANDHYTKDFSF